MHFVDRADAGRQLAARLAPFRGSDVVVLGLPRGGVLVAAEVAAQLDAPLDVLVVRKLGVPGQPELAMGAVGESDARTLDPARIRAAGVTAEALQSVEERERAELRRRAESYRAGRAPVSLAGRTAIIVDDGIATGSTARVACGVARAEGAARVVLAVPVAPVGVSRSIGPVADEIVVLSRPAPFRAVGCWYEDFSQTTDAQVLACLERARTAPGSAGGVPSG